jgi:glutathione S-transferase
MEMIKLCGFAVSNYYNKIKLVLLEKEIEFTEEIVAPSQDEALLKRSPLGKIPFIETEHGCLSESQVILEYLEELYPSHPLYPSDTYQKAKCREIIQHLELNIELHARRLYKEVFFGGTVSEEVKIEVKQLLEKGLNGLARLGKFSPYIAGDIFTAADIVAWLHFFMVSITTQKIYGQDMASGTIPQLADYMQLIGSRPAVQKVAADRDVAIATFFKK